MQRLMLAVSGFFLVISLAGCYTLLRHPEIAEVNHLSVLEEHPGPEAEVGYNNDCLVCHGDGYEPFAYSAGYYGFSHAPYSSSMWLYYYDYPWWVDDSEAAYDADVKTGTHRKYGVRSRRKNLTGENSDFFAPTSSGGGGGSAVGSVGSGSGGGASGSSSSASGNADGHDGGKDKVSQRNSGTRTISGGSEKQDRPAKTKKSTDDEKDE